MTRFLRPDDAIDFAKARRKRRRERAACFLHLRDLVCLHPDAAPASAVSFVRTLEAKVVAEKAAREFAKLETAGQSMRDHAHTLSDFRVPSLSIECEPCGRAGRYNVAKLTEPTLASGRASSCRGARPYRRKRR